MQRTRVKKKQILYVNVYIHRGFPCGSDGKASACNAGDPGSIPGSGSSPGEYLQGRNRDADMQTQRGKERARRTEGVALTSMHHCV